jgi:hypothetical protein
LHVGNSARFTCPVRLCELPLSQWPERSFIFKLHDNKPNEEVSVVKVTWGEIKAIFGLKLILVVFGRWVLKKDLV